MTDRGHAGIELALAVAVLLLPVALVVTGFGPWSEARVAAAAVAAEASRAAVIALSHEVGVDAASQTASTMGFSKTHVRLGWCGSTPDDLQSPGGACSLSRGAVVSARIEIWTPLIVTPWGGIGGLWVGAEHAEPIDLYRSLG